MNLLWALSSIINFQTTICSRMESCTVSKCWPDVVSGVCSGGFYQLAQLNNPAMKFLTPLSAWNKTSIENPSYMWEVYLTHVSASSFLAAEISGLTICQGHKVITKCVSVWIPFFIYRRILWTTNSHLKTNICVDVSFAALRIIFVVWHTPSTRNYSHSFKKLYHLEQVFSHWHVILGIHFLIGVCDKCRKMCQKSSPEEHLLGNNAEQKDFRYWII